jgi:hypothetical protein
MRKRKARIYDPGDPLSYTTNIQEFKSTGNTSKEKKTLGVYLAQQEYYRKHKPLRPPRKTAAMRVLSIGQNFFMDTFQVTQMSKKNKGIKYILVFVDGFSKYLSCALLKSKNVEETKKGLEHILQSLQVNNLLAPSCVIGCDQDSTYYSKIITEMLETKYAAYCYRLRAPKKAFLAELFGKLIMQKIYRHITVTGQQHFIDVFDDLVLSINRLKRKELVGLSAQEVNHNNQIMIQQYNQNKYDKLMSLKRTSTVGDLHVGDLVLVQNMYGIFYKTHRGRWDVENKYRIVNVLDHHTVTRYRIKDVADNMEVNETFYSSSLQKIAEEIPQATKL